MSHEEMIREYYSRVDAGDVEWVLDLFDDESEYVRADAWYSNKAEIATFYREQRKIIGAHTLENLYHHRDTVIVNGVFRGAGVDGSRRRVGFADFWRFNSVGRVIHRATYLAVGSGVVRE